jgi:Family of unknown function (DUF5996)
MLGTSPRGASPRGTPAAWRPLPWHDWGDTLATLHMWTQIIGKIRTAQTPPLNHWWHSTLYVSAHGLTTTSIPYGDRLFQLDFDFVDHRLVIEESGGRSTAIDLRPMSVATFYRRVMEELGSLDIEVRIRTKPTEVAVAIPFEEDEEHATYDRDHAHACWQGLTAAHRVLTRFRGPYLGKASPVHFFWGGFDLAVTRFSGRSAPRHPGGVPNCPDWVQEEAYSREVSSAGWWPLNPDLGPAFYSYTYPQPTGFAEAVVRPDRATYDRALGEFILRDEDVADVPDPESAVLDFLESTYEAGAGLAGWDRAALEADYPRIGEMRRAWSVARGART